MRKEMRNIIRTIYGLPPAAVVTSCSILILVCYFVLPLAAGVPIIAAAALLPWLEERLSKDDPGRGR